MLSCPQFPGEIRKNDGIFLYGAQFPKPFVFAYEQKKLEIIYGPSCKPESELKIRLCLEDNVAVQPRRGGGGTVILSPGVVVIVVVGERKGTESPLEIFNRIHDAMIAILCSEGINTIEKKGISDLAINDRKILGSSLYMGTVPRFYYYQSSLMVSSDISLMNRYLEHPPREPDYRMGRGHEAFCTTLNNQGFFISAAQICEILNCSLQKMINSLSI